jgi:hypothetical protein
MLITFLLISGEGEKMLRNKNFIAIRGTECKLTRKVTGSIKHSINARVAEWKIAISNFAILNEGEGIF